MMAAPFEAAPGPKPSVTQCVTWSHKLPSAHYSPPSAACANPNTEPDSAPREPKAPQQEQAIQKMQAQV